MGLLDNVLGSAVPGGGLGKPVGAALLALLASKATGGSLFSGGDALAPANSGQGFAGSSGAPQGGGQGLLGQILGSLGGGQGTAADGMAGQGMAGGQGLAGLAEQQLPGLISGGLGGLLQHFQQRGYGDVMNSWIGNGANQSIRPEELHQALGQETVDNLSQQTGMAPHDLVSQLAQALPQFVDRMTPQGRVPEQGEVARWT